MRWLRRRSSAPSKLSAAARRCSFALAVEQLEDRRLLAVGFPNVTYHGGPLLQNAQVESVFYGTAWNSDANLQQQVTQVNGFLQYFVTSPYMDVLKQYNVGHSSFTGDQVIAQNPPGGQTIDDSQIQSVLNAEIGNHTLAAPTGNALYVFTVEPGVTVTAGGQNSANDFAGYHSVFTDSAGAPVYYVVLPYPTGNVSAQQLTDFQQETLILSHEVSEAVTDPDTQSGWFDRQNGEIGDIAEGQQGILHGYVVQAVWSQQAGQSVVPTDNTGSSLQVAGTQVQATLGQPFTSVVATVTGAPTGSTTDSFSASIDWGDGQTSAGTVTIDPKSGFDITGTHSYTKAGTFAVSVTVDDANGKALGSALSQASVTAPTPSFHAHGTRFQATAGTAFSGTVASFTDTNGTPTANSFSATIDWGDGTTSAGTVVADPKGGFDVTGTHTYASISQPLPVPVAVGSGWDFHHQHGGFGDQYYVVKVTITDTVDNTTALAVSLADVAPAPPNIVAKGKNIQATGDVAFTGTVATFTDTNPKASPVNLLSATIDWGDGSTSAGSVAADPNGGFDVTGTHTYPVLDPSGLHWFPIGYGAGKFILTVTITDTGTQDQAVTRSVATVSPAAPIISLDAQNIKATAGQAFSGTVATFTDTKVSPTATDTFTATIDWGDGTTSTGKVVADPKGGFDVTGTHTYAADTTPTPVWGAYGDGLGFGVGGDLYTLTVNVSDTSGDTASDRSVAAVAPAPPNIDAKGTLVQAVSGTAFTGTVATFTSKDATPKATDFTAAIDWGDGTTSTGTVAVDPNGGFDVTGTHTYTITEGSGDPNATTSPPLPPMPTSYALHGHHLGDGDDSFVITVSIADTTTTDTATAVSLATVAPTAPNITATGQALSLTAGQSFTGSVASFKDADGQGIANYNATISWGDGTVTPGTLAANTAGGFDITGTHTYATGGTYHVLVVIHDQDGDSAVSVGSAKVADSTTPTTLSQVDQALAQCAEHLGNVVTADYQQYLGRTPGTSEVAYWVGIMQNGVTDEQVLADFAGSPEYYQHAGGSAKGWVDAMYHDLLSRTADTSGEAFWTSVLGGGTTRDAVVLGFATSPEHEAGVVQTDYQTYLGRSATPAEVTGWVNSFKSGTTNEQIIGGFLGSKEYYQEQGGNAKDWVTSVYQALLSRKPDQAGLNGWLSVLGEPQG